MPEPCAETLLIDALAADETLFDRLVAAHAVYRRFASVLMREDTAGRLTLADIAHMAAVPVPAVLGIARTDAGPADASAQDGGPGERVPLPVGRPSWADERGGPVAGFDARPQLQGGHEPLADLLAFAQAAPPSAVLVIETTFHAEPLRRLFEGRGYQSAAEALSADHWRIHLRPPAGRAGAS